MHVLHIDWRPPNINLDFWHHDEGSFYVWAEDGDKPQPPLSKLTQRVRTKVHPFFTSFRDLDSSFLSQTGLSYHAVNPAKITLHLPSHAYGPIPSPQLTHSWVFDESANTTISNPWQVEGANLHPGQAISFLSSLLHLDQRPENIQLGQNCLYWLCVAHWAMELVAEGKLIEPQSTHIFESKFWRANLLEPKALKTFEKLVALVPPNYTIKPTDETIPVEKLLTSGLNALVHKTVMEGNHLTFRGFTGRIRKWATGWLVKTLPDESTTQGFSRWQLSLHQNYDFWWRNLYFREDEAYRFTVRLEAPQPEVSNTESPWMIYFYLQSRQDPSLLIDVQDLGRLQIPGAEESSSGQQHEHLLKGMLFLHRLFAPVQITRKARSSQDISLIQAFHFMRDVASLLEASGIGVLIPPWWNNKQTTLNKRLTLTPQDEGKSNGDSSQQLIHYQWDVSLGDITMTREEFEALVALKMPLVQIRGQWVHLDPSQVEAALDFWETQSLAGDVTPLEALQMGLGATDEGQPLPIAETRFEGWLGEWVEKMTQPERLAVLPAPESLQAELRPYQAFGYSWLDFMHRRGLGVILADDMGLGKTIQTLTTLLKDKEASGQLPGPVLVVCPTSVVANWYYEAERFTPGLAALMHQGPQRPRQDAFLDAIKSVDLVLTSYALVRLEAETMKQINWYGVILDEAQNIKNPSTKQAQAIRALPAQFRVALTGTPIENRLGELWSIMHFLNPGYLSSQKAFQTTFARPIEKQQNEETAAQLRQMITPFVLRRVKTDPTVIQDLPEKQESKVYCYLSKEQATLYQATVRKALQEMEQAEGIKRRGIILGLLTRLKQICNHPAQFLHQIGEGTMPNPTAEMKRSGKVTRLTEILEEVVAVGDHSLIFTQFTEMGRYLVDHIQQVLNIEVLFLHGGIPAKQRTKMVQQFQAESGGPPIFVLSLKAGGTGLNLTRANQVFHFDRWWNPAVEDQATDRAFRIGQHRHVQVYKFICQGTLEDRIDGMIEGKKMLADQIVGQNENWLTELTTAEIQDLVTLRKDVFG
ncbi:MAG: DEAD/DEAH box helicase [Chloroflexota bacterium]